MFRDWRGLAHSSNLSGEILPLLMSHSDPSAYILSIWQERQKDVTLKDLQTALEEIDRWDIIDDTSELFEKDAAKYLSSENSAEVIENEIDKKILTVDDIYRVRQGLQNQYYDAFLLYADEDENFALMTVEKLEKQYNLKLCLKDRDLIGGITFEHQAVMTLISERCNRLIVIVSPNFLKSPANDFFLSYAQGSGICKGQRKIIPCLYGQCELPRQLNYMFVLDYKRCLYNFWERLRDSVKTVNGVNTEKELQLFTENEAIFRTVKTNIKYQTEENPKCLTPLKEDEVLKDVNESLVTVETPNNSKLDNVQDKNKKRMNFMPLWRKWIRKVDYDKRKYTITKTISLPSLENLPSLNTSIDSIQKKQKSKISRYLKKVPLRS
ncbi:myeloid differentiation primary response protein MyD88 isoform X2 [Megachile rotundata]|uniref:myeloid differentiation primary response protein MyD88 isoform X2 n=1 Tax=Megachile rotundata TaxID=143995 RepID=UPI000615284C|nr:PREDICTED: myeloid differentiation primary response protein MyD88 isoform X2 [Megachile rotundata]